MKNLKLAAKLINFMVENEDCVDTFNELKLCNHIVNLVKGPRRFLTKFQLAKKRLVQMKLDTSYGPYKIAMIKWYRDKYDATLLDSKNWIEDNFSNSDLDVRSY